MASIWFEEFWDAKQRKAYAYIFGCVDIGAVLDEILDNLGVVLDAGAEERRAAGRLALAVYAVVDVEAVLDQALDARERARLGRYDQRVYLRIVQIQRLLVYLGPMLQKLLQQFYQKANQINPN